MTAPLNVAPGSTLISEPGATPHRIQRRRTKGWRMPEGAVYVGRPSRWGNPFRFTFVSTQTSIVLYEDVLTGFWKPSRLAYLGDDLYSAVYAARDALIRGLGPGDRASMARSELHGRDLACWCPLDQPCHADVLLRLANRGAS